MNPNPKTSRFALTEAEQTRLMAAVSALMAGNRVVVGNHRYTRPAPSVYEQQWLWDSCFHAVILSHLDLTMAMDELRSLLWHAGVDTGGLLPHMIDWQGGSSELWGNPFVSFLTQPPLLAEAVLCLYRRGAGRDFLREVYPQLAAYYHWLRTDRDPDGDGLIGIIHPWESGWDASPRWDALLGLSHPTPAESKAARLRLAAALREDHRHAPTLTTSTRFWVEPVDFNAIFAANLEALALIAETIGDDAGVAEWRAAALDVRKAMNARMWDDEAGCYWDLAGTDEEPIRVPTAAPFVTLYGGVPDEQRAARLVAHLCAPRFAVPFPVPTVATDDPTFAPADYWRGNTWLPVNWLIGRGLRLYGYHELAADLARHSLALVMRTGFYEYYHPLTGAGLGSHPHSWSGLVLDMVSTLLDDPNDHDPSS